MTSPLTSKPLQVRVGAFDVHKIGVKALDWRDPFRVVATLSWPGFFLAVLISELSINTLFAMFYALVPGCIANAAPGSFKDAFFFSLETLATVGYGAMSPATLYGHVVSAIEIVCGMLYTAVLTGLVFFRFARPRSKFLFADRAVISRHNAQDALMIRLGNGDRGVLANAKAKVNALIMDESIEGNRSRRFHALKLVRDEFPLLALTWTLVHIIDHSSPLYGLDQAQWISNDIRLFLTVEAWDVGLSTQVYDLKSYRAIDIAFGVRYADAVAWDANGNTVADMAKISSIEILSE